MNYVSFFKKFLLSIVFMGVSSMILAQVNKKEIGNLVMEDVPEIPTRISERMWQYQNTRSAGIQGWLPDGNGILITTRFSETAQLHIVEQPLGMRQQITFYGEPIGSVNVNPNPSNNNLLFTKDIGGNEFYQVFLFDLSKRQATMLTDGKSRNGSTLWSNKGDQFVFTSTKRNGKDYDIFVSKLTAPTEAKPILEKEGLWYPTDWSPDDSKLIVGQYISANESYLHILEVASGKMTQINPSSEKIAYGGAAWSADGKGIFIISDEKNEFQILKYYDIATQKFTDLTSNIAWDISNFSLSPDRSKMAFIANENGISKLYMLNTKNKKYKSFGKLPIGIVGGLAFNPKGTQLAVTINTAQTPSDVFVLDAKNGKTVRWTASETGGLKTDSFVIPQLVEYETFDQVNGKARKIPAFYFKPQNAKGKTPVLIIIHGGPEAQYQPNFSSQVQYYTNEMGIAVLAPNVRGSSGYGKTYLQLDNGFKREESVKDIGALLDWIAKQPELDASRVAVMGGSYGGYMTLASLVHYSDRLKCGIDVVGISNFVTFLNNTQDYRRDLRRVEYGDERDPAMKEFLEKIAPLNNAQKITKPLFVIQGLNDPRVPVTEAEQMVAKIREIGGKVWYLMAKDEGHGFRKKVNTDFYNNAVVMFLEENLLK
jgi:dipeptidyl aminopeptidase/acylaminoacyl peptidase